MKKIVVFGFTDNIGGIETFYMTYYRKLDKKEYQIDFISFFDNMVFEEEVKNNGSMVYKVHNPKKNPILYRMEIKKILKEQKYDIAHVNMLSAANILPLKIAKSCKIKKVIAHSHNNNTPTGIVRKLMHVLNKNKISKYANEYMACSTSAGTWMFGVDSEFIVIKNAIELNRFLYNEEWRNEIRKKYNINNNSYLIGHVGRLSEQKNQLFLISIFKELIKNKNIYLMLVGSGEKKQEILEMISKYNLQDNIILIDNTLEVYKYYSAFDLFVFPSTFEGLGIVALEAQVSGLKCIFSENIVKEVDLMNNKYIPLSNKEKWIDEIKKCNLSTNRNINYNAFSENGFNIENEYKKLENIYEN